MNGFESPSPALEKNTMAEIPVIPTAPTPPPAPQRHALGLPEGSIRSILALMVVGLFCGELLISPPTAGLPPYLIYLLFLIVGHFFAGHGTAHGPADHPSPLYVPRGLVRLLIILALVASISWKANRDPDSLLPKWDATVELMKAQWMMPLLLLGGFFVGVIIRMFVGHNPPPVAQDFEAWVALLAVICLVIAGFIHLVINPSLAHPISLPNWEGFLGVIVAFYFGARS
jgi:hypothetical protein